MRTVHNGKYTYGDFQNDIFGRLTAAIVALPLALAFGVISGAGAIAGLYGAIATGFFAAVFGGTPAQISGPTGPMTVVMSTVIAMHANSLGEAFTIVMIGGVIQLLFGALRLGKYITYTPYSVVSGFMTGIGIIIIAIETLPFLGLPAAPGGVPGMLAAILHTDFTALDWRVPALAISALGIVIAWPAPLRRLIPSPLAALVLGTLAAIFVMPGLPEIGEVPSGLPTLISPTISPANLPGMIQTGFMLALLGSIDSLLTSLVSDSITKTRHDSDKELVGQGIGNIAAGLIGGLPGAGATMRTLVNVRAGGRTPISGVLHALVLLGLALGLGPLVEHVPHAVLAAILMKVGWDIIDWSYLKRMRKAPREKFIIMLITLGLTVFVDLITAVAVGIILASFVNSRHLAQEQLKGVTHTKGNGDNFTKFTRKENELLEASGGKIEVTMLYGTFSYASARELARVAVPELVDQEIEIYDFTHAGYMDTSAAIAVQEIFETTLAAGKTVLVSGLHGQALKALEALGALDTIPHEYRQDTRAKAIKVASAMIARQGF